MYGSKHAVWQWYKDILATLQRLEYDKILPDYGLFVRGEGVGQTIVAIFVDDISIAGIEVKRTKKAKEEVKQAPPVVVPAAIDTNAAKKTITMPTDTTGKK